MSFLERFKGKTSLMTKDGITGIHNSNDKPIDKPQLISIVNEKESQKIIKHRSLNIFLNNEPKIKERNFHSISSQSNKPSHFIQAAKNSIGMATYDFAPERNNHYSSQKDPQIPLSASPFINNTHNKSSGYKPKPKNGLISMSAELNLRKVPVEKGNGVHYRKDNSVGSKRNNGISVIREQNEEPEEDFEELEKKHLEFLEMVEKIHFK